MKLKDPYNRPVNNLRISLTPACNLRCIYCHAEGEVSSQSLLPAGQIGEIMQIAREFEFRSVKFTGGEPLLRPDILEIIRSVPEGMECSLTTNGTLLSGSAADMKDAGLSRVNISLDSLNRQTYQRITGRDCLNDVLEGIEAAIEAGLTPVKLNMVVLSEMNEGEVEDFIHFVSGNRNMVLQLIELMDLKECPYHSDLNELEDRIAQHSTRIITRRMHHRRKYCLDGSEVEVVRPLHNTEFCAFCNRLRLTSDGKLKPCLLRTDNHVDVRGKSGHELRELFIEAVRRRAPYYS
jgi:cyclic pyranopterin phosphate synthase